MKIWSIPVFKEQDQIVKLKASNKQADRKQIDRFSVAGFCSHFNTVFQATDYLYHFCHYQEVRPSFNEEDIQRSGKNKRREFDEFRRHKAPEEGFTIFEL